MPKEYVIRVTAGAIVLAQARLDAQLRAQMASTQLETIRRDWEHIQYLLIRRRYMVEATDYDFGELVRLDSYLDERIEEYAKSKVYA